LNHQELIIKLQQGDDSAFAMLVEENQDMVYNTALVIVQNADDADDITQEVFIQAYQSISSFKSGSKLSTWLYCITVNKTLDYKKKMNRKKRLGFVQSLFGAHTNEEVRLIVFDHPGLQLEKKESAAVLFNALKQIPYRQRIAFTLHKIEGQSYQEIAEIMKTTLPSVEALMSRAKVNLKNKLSNYYIQ